MRLVERLQPRAARLLNDAIRTSTDCLVIQGEQGSGKSLLLDYLAGTPGIRTIRVHVPWGSLADQLLLVPAAAAQLQNLVSSAGQAIPPELIEELSAPPAGEISTAELVARVERLLAIAASLPEPVWILIDDVDALHEELMPALRYAIARTGHLPGGLICTSTWAVPALDSYRHIVLEALDEEAVGAWVEDRTGVRPPKRVAKQLHYWSAGRPAMLTDLVQSAAPEALTGARRLVAGPPCEPVRRYVERALARVDEATRELLTVLTLAGSLDVPSFTALAEDLGLHGARLLMEPLIQFEGSRVRVANGVVGRVLAYDNSHRRAEASARVVAVAADQLSAEDRVLLSAHAPGHETELSRLAEAAVGAVERGESQRAHDLLEAMTLHTTTATYPRFALTRVRVMFLDGYVRDALDAAEDDLARLPVSRERLDIVAIAVLARLLLGQDFELGVVLEEMRAHAPELPAMTAEMTCELALLALYVGHATGARRLVRTVQELLPSDLLTASPWQYVMARIAPLPVHADLLRDFRRWLAEDLSAPLSPGQQVELVMREDPLTAMHHLGAELSRPLPPVMRAFLLVLKAYVESERGDVKHAIRALEELDELQRIEHFATALRLTSVLRVAAMTGSALSGADRRALEQALQSPRHLFTLRLYVVKACWLLAIGEDRAEAERLIVAVARADSQRPDVPAAVAVGDPDFQVISPGLFLALRVGQGQTEEARRYFRSVVLGRAGASVHADAAIDLGRALGLGEGDEEGQAGMIDLSIFPAWARPAMARLLSEAAPAQTRTTAPGADPSLAVMLGLTGREAEVARRILDGMRNKDIAEALYLSLRSVEATVTQLFRKTGTRSRAALVAALLNSANGTREVASSNGDGSRTVLEA